MGDRRCRIGAPGLALAIAVVLVLGGPVRPVTVQAQEGDSGRCAQTGAVPYQPQLAEANTVFERAATDRLGPSYPRMPQIGRGGPAMERVSPSIPCVLLKAIGFVESNWHQATYSTPRGARGFPLINPLGCAYGIGQIASGMQRPGELERELQYRIAHDYVTNIAYAAKVLAEKWIATPVVGGNDPATAEHWYYAVWAYHGFGWYNNPNNPRYDPSRPAFDGRQSFGAYPYQELVWGFAAHPPAPAGPPLWSSVPLTLPDRRHFPTDPTTPPGPIPEPSPTHTSACPVASITRSPAELTFLADPGSVTPHSATLALRDPYGAGFAWRAAATATWVSLSPTAGSSLPADLRVTVNPAGLPVGTHRATMTVTASDGSFAPVTTGVTLVIAPVQRLYLPFAARSSP